MRYEDSMKGVAAQIIKEQLRASKIKNNPEDFHWHDEYATLNFFRWNGVIRFPAFAGMETYGDSFQAGI